MFRDGSLLQAATMCELGSILLGGASLVQSIMLYWLFQDFNTVLDM
jgi:hypothetical protein